MFCSCITSHYPLTECNLSKVAWLVSEMEGRNETKAAATDLACVPSPTRARLSLGDPERANIASKLKDGKFCINSVKHKI